MKKIVIIGLLLVLPSLLGMDVPPAKTETTITALPPEVIAMITPMVADADTPIQAVQNVKNFLIEQKAWAPLLSDAQHMGEVAKNIANKFPKVDLLDILLLLNTPGSKIAYQDDLKKQNIIKVVKRMKVGQAKDLNELLVSWEDQIVQNESLKEWLIKYMFDMHGVASLNDFLNTLSGQEDPALLSILFKDKTIASIRSDYGVPLQNLLFKAVYSGDSPMLVKKLLSYGINPNSIGPERVPIPGGITRRYEGKRPLEIFFEGVSTACKNPDYSGHRATLDFLVLQSLLQPGAKASRDSFETFKKQC